MGFFHAPKQQRTKGMKTKMTLQEFFTTLKGAAMSLLPQSRPEQAAMGIGAAIGAIFSLLFGGLGEGFHALLALVMLDFFTGFAAAGKQGELSSAQGRRGIAHKFFIIATVALTNLISKGMGSPMLCNMAICAFSANEGLSILENIDRLGYGKYIPAFLCGKIAEIRKAKTGEGGESK
jgi:toxin secretion/phage lysis holin